MSVPPRMRSAVEYASLAEQAMAESERRGGLSLTSHAAATHQLGMAWVYATLAVAAAQERGNELVEQARL